MTSDARPLTDASLREQVAWSCRILALGDHGDYTLGHVSARSADGQHMLMKRYGLGLEEVTPDDVLRLDLDGNILEGNGRAHLEYVLHSEIYRVRPDVQSVIHTHPPYATAFGATDAELQLLNHDAVLFKDGLAYFEDTVELIMHPEQGAQVAAALGDRRVVLLRGHGVLFTGVSVPWATYTALTLERVLRIQAIARSLGNLKPMSAEMASLVYPDKYQDGHIHSYWEYLIRGVLRAGLGQGMPVREAAHA
ncbi:MAG: class II aldolase/adducin family protein [Thermomicrobiales bacterium]|nr:class II aldolase/adducin family protein [Thermomicrobiales bacterium]